MPTLTWVLVALGLARLLRLWIDDRVGVKPRQWVMLRSSGSIQALLVCPWCLSGWLCLAAVLAAALVAQEAVIVALWFPLWWGTCLAYFTLEMVAKAAAPKDPT